jgi:hypothetical protein
MTGSRLLPVAAAIASLFYPGQLLSAGDLIANLQPSELTSAYGPVKQVVLNTPRLSTLDPHSLAHYSSGSMVHFRFPEPVWIIGYETEIYDGAGRPPTENYLCHTFIGNHHVEQLKTLDGKVIASEMKGLFSDAFTKSVHLPDGFGIQLTPNEDMEWMPMFNNRTDDYARVAMRAVIYVIRECDLKKPMQPVYSVLESVKTPHLFDVPPGRHEQETTFELPFDGKLHLIGAHIHPYAKSVRLVNVTRTQAVWNGIVTEDAHGQTAGMPLYSDPKGYPVHAGDVFRLTSRYENPNDFPIDAMAGVFIVYTRN